jgi:hypothetical protein
MMQERRLEACNGACDVACSDARNDAPSKRALRLLFHERFLALVQRDAFPGAYAAALLSRSRPVGAASRGDQRFPAAGSGGFMPRC